MAEWKLGQRAKAKNKYTNVEQGTVIGFDHRNSEVCLVPDVADDDEAYWFSEDACEPLPDVGPERYSKEYVLTHKGVYRNDQGEILVTIGGSITETYTTLAVHSVNDNCFAKAVGFLNSGYFTREEGQYAVKLVKLD
jgi:hypothetical protein